MKRNLIRLAAAALSAACLLSLSACSGKNDDKGSSSSASASSAATSSGVSGLGSSSAGTPASSAAELAASGKFATVEEFVNSDVMQSQFESMKSSLEGDSGVTVDLTGEGNKLVYIFTYVDLDDVEDIDALSEALEASIDQLASTFQGVAAALKDAVEEENPVVVVRYAAPDGTLLLDHEFTAEE